MGIVRFPQDRVGRSLVKVIMGGPSEIHHNHKSHFNEKEIPSCRLTSKDPVSFLWPVVLLCSFEVADTQCSSIFPSIHYKR